ncbi:MAG: hypothetical protein II604_06430 [Bacteroidales bacterium]|nr:hypothetical protein [Bacteroidales bacterium]
MRKILSAIMILLLSAGIVLAQNVITKKPSSNTGNSGTTTTTTTKSDTNNQSAPSAKDAGTEGSTETKGNPSTPATTSTNSSTETSPWANTTPTDDTPATTTTAKSDVTLDHFIIGGGISAGGLISTDIISTGGMINAEFEVMVQFKHHRLGIGGDKTLMLNLRNLGTVIGTLGKSNCNLNKVYFTYEWTLFKRSPINFTAGFKVGSFDVGKSEYRTEQENNNQKATKSPFFAAAAIALEVGHPRFLLYIKPEIGFHSYDTGSWRKDIYAMATVGFRWKTKRLDKYDSMKTATEPEKKFE